MDPAELQPPMSDEVSLHVVYQIVNAPIRMFPFPHIYVRDVFPPDYYREIRASLPSREAFRTLTALGRVGEGYSESRLVLPMTPNHLERVPEPMRGFWSRLSAWMLGGSFGQVMVGKFGEFVQQRLGDLSALRFHDEALLVQDYTRYALGPHTDSPAKVLSFLFYLPADDSRAHLGTSLYVPRDSEFLCPGGPHHSFDLFRRVCAMPYLPNALFAFPKSANSFHGVEPLAQAEVRRDLLLYDIKVENPPEFARQTPAPAQSAARPGSSV